MIRGLEADLDSWLKRPEYDMMPAINVTKKKMLGPKGTGKHSSQGTQNLEARCLAHTMIHGVGSAKKCMRPPIRMQKPAKGKRSANASLCKPMFFSR